MLMAVKNQWRVCYLSIKYNIMREMINRVSFLTNVVFMMLNNATFIIQWLILFRIKNEIGGYHMKEVMLLWSIAATTYGWAHVLFRGAFSLPDLIVNGKLDSYLVQPKNVLLGVITSGTDSSAIGDILYGYLVMVIINRNANSLFLFTLLSITGAIILTSFTVLVGSLCFWIIRGEMLTSNLTNLLINFSTYPDGIFKSVIRFVLYFIIPVGIVNYIPVRLIQKFNIVNFIVIVGYTIIITIAAFIIFYRGLRRYSSSSLMVAKI